MTFKFAWFVELLQSLDAARIDKALPSSRSSNPDHQIVKQWFSKYGLKIVRHGESGYAFLACMFPERLPQRSYGIQETRLSAIFGRALGLGSGRARTLKAWRGKDSHDFASCVESVMAECESDPPSPAREVTLEEIDTALVQIAANSPFSSPAIREQANTKTTDQLLAPIVRRLRSHEAKWLVRMILKSYSPIEIPESTTMAQIHFLLPNILAIQNSIDAAVAFLSERSVCTLPSNPERALANALRHEVTKHLVPRIGTMVRRQPYDKARSIKHCCSMADKRLMSIERKYDGEYCQIHIDRSQGHHCVQIFSKSGKDSTDDRIRLHGAIKQSLSLDRDDCKIKQKCILEGELLIWNRTRAAIEPFYKIRRHVTRGGRYLGTENDSPAAADEHLMIMFFDLLLLDDKVFANEPHSARRQHLKGIVRRIPGLADICERELISFGSRRAPEQLREAFAKSITQGWEGFVLKGCNEPYFSLNRCPRAIKLKKDYITGLGDTADLCVVGGRRDPRLIEEFKLEDVSWTTFYLACVENREELIRFGGKPRFKIIDTMGPRGIPKNDILELNKLGKFMQLPFALDRPELVVNIAISPMNPPTDLFKSPVVVEVMGAAFEKNSGCDFFTIRFPRLTRIHLDRTIEESTTFAELQELAKGKASGSPNVDSQVDADWIERLILADGRSKYIIDKSQSPSPGKTPRSAATASLSPISARKVKPPVLVRTDSGDLSQQELEARHHGSQTWKSSVTTPASVSMRSKRKSSVLETTPTLGPNAASKRRRISPRNSSPQANSLTDISQSSRRNNSQTFREWAEGLGAGAVTRSRPADSSASTTWSRVPASARRPLTEMTNVSPQLQRRTLPQAGSPANETKPRECERLGTSVAPLASASADVVMAQARVGPEFPFLPTPPTSSAESAAAGNPKSVAPGIPGKREWPAPETVQSAPPRKIQQSTTLEPLNTPLLLSRSLTTDDGESTEGRALDRLLRQSDMSFTFSLSSFVRHFFQEPKRCHTVLVDAQKSETVARNIFDLGLTLVNSPNICNLEERTQVAFLDYGFLRIKSSTFKQSVNLSALTECFIAWLQLGPDIIDEKGEKAARVVWTGLE